jgi:hypothetical protein
MDAAKRLMVLPVEAQKRFERVADENRLLKLQLDSQKVIISDLSNSLGDNDEIEKALQATNEHLAEVDGQLADASAMLLEQLSESGNQPAPEAAGELIKLLVTKVQGCVSDLAVNGVSQGSMSVSVLGLVELEEQIRKIIEDLHDKGMYPETDEEAEARMAGTHAHTAAVLKFLQGFVGAQEGER